MNSPRPTTVTEIDRTMIMRGAGPIVDRTVLDTIIQLDFGSWFVDANPRSLPPAILDEYLDTFASWIAASRLNSITGLDAFPYHHLTSGITQAFDDFVVRHRARTIKYLPGEYPYIRRIVPEAQPLGMLEAGDAIAISIPFSATGHVHEETETVLEQASQLDVPVLIDCAFFGICQNVRIDVAYPCVESVCFSNSKAFASGNFRAGIAFSRHDTGILPVLNSWRYVHLLAAKVNMALMEKYSPDYIFEKYRGSQLAVCDALDLKPSDTVIFGIGKNEYDEFSMDGIINRCAITEAIRVHYDATR
jgi:hypothetical protein